MRFVPVPGLGIPTHDISHPRSRPQPRRLARPRHQRLHPEHPPHRPPLQPHPRPRGPPQHPPRHRHHPHRLTHWPLAPPRRNRTAADRHRQLPKKRHPDRRRSRSGGTPAFRSNRHSHHSHPMPQSVSLSLGSPQPHRRPRSGTSPSPSTKTSGPAPTSSSPPAGPSSPSRLCYWLIDMRRLNETPAGEAPPLALARLRLERHHRLLSSPT